MGKAGGFGLPAFLSALVMDRDHQIALCALALALVLAYGASFGNSFHYDDFHSIVENPHLRSLDRIATFFSDPGTFSSMPERAMYRPLLLVTLAFNYALGSYEVVGYHLVNWLLHLGCAMLVYALGRVLHDKRRAALLGALLFALHPLNAEAVNYISRRSESLAAFFYLAALCYYIRWRQQGTGYCWLLSLVAFACAVLSKSVAIVLPVALVAYERWGRGRTAVVAGGLWRYHAANWALAGVCLLLARSWLGDSLERPVRGLGEQLVTQVKAAVYYVKLIVAPTQLSVEHPFAVARSTAPARGVAQATGSGRRIRRILYARPRISTQTWQKPVITWAISIATWPGTRRPSRNTSGSSASSPIMPEPIAIWANSTWSEANSKRRLRSGARACGSCPAR